MTEGLFLYSVRLRVPDFTVFRAQYGVEGILSDFLLPHPYAVYIQGGSYSTRYARILDEHRESRPFLIFAFYSLPFSLYASRRVSQESDD
jgi:hypothetical protein